MRSGVSVGEHCGGKIGLKNCYLMYFIITTESPCECVVTIETNYELDLGINFIQDPMFDEYNSSR